MNKVCRLVRQDTPHCVTGSEDDSLKTSTVTVTLTLRTAIDKCHKILRFLMITHHCTMLQKGSEVEEYGMNSYILRISTCIVTLTLTLKTGTHIFRMSTAGHGDTTNIPSFITNGSVLVQKISSGQNIFLEPRCDPDL